MKLLPFTESQLIVHFPAKASSALQWGQQACQPLPQSPSCPCRNPLAPTCPPPPPQLGWCLQRPVLQISWTWKQLGPVGSFSICWCQCAWQGLYNTTQDTRTRPPHLCPSPCWPAPVWIRHSSAWSRSIQRGHETSLRGQRDARFSSDREMWGPAGQSSSGLRTRPPP